MSLFKIMLSRGVDFSTLTSRCSFYWDYFLMRGISSFQQFFICLWVGDYKLIITLETGFWTLSWLPICWDLKVTLLCYFGYFSLLMCLTTDSFILSSFIDYFTLSYLADGYLSFYSFLSYFFWLVGTSSLLLFLGTCILNIIDWFTIFSSALSTGYPFTDIS